MVTSKTVSDPWQRSHRTHWRKAYAEAYVHNVEGKSVVSCSYRHNTVKQLVLVMTN